MSGLSQEARALIDGVSDLDAPSAADRARIQQRLSLQLGAAAFASSMLPLAAGGAAQGVEGAALAPKSAWFGSLGKAVLALGALGGVTAALLLSGPEPAHTRHAAAATAPKATVTPAQAPPTQVLPSVPSSEMPPAPTSTTAARSKLPSHALRQTTVTRGGSDIAPASTLSQEIALLGRAQAALRAGRGSEALALTEEHARLFPQGVLKQERMGVAALAECAVPGREHTQADPFLKLAPSSPLAARVRKVCGLP